MSTAYNGPGKLSELTLGKIWRAVAPAYGYFAEPLYKVTAYNTDMLSVINKILTVTIVVVIVACFVGGNMSLPRKILVVELVILLPLALNCIYLVSMGTMHQLMQYAFCMVYILPVVLVKDFVLSKQEIGQIFKKTVISATVVGCLLISYYNFSYGNGAYTYKKLVYDETMENVQDIWYDVNSLQGYEEGVTEVVFMGSFSASRAKYESEISTRYENILTGIWCNSAVTYDGTLSNYMQYIMGKNMVVVMNSEDLLDNAEYLDMPAYPEEGYVRWIDGRVVVRLSE